MEFLSNVFDLVNLLVFRHLLGINWIINGFEQVIQDEFGIVEGLMTTVHATTGKIIH